jgi:hypothetical protein
LAGGGASALVSADTSFLPHAASIRSKTPMEAAANVRVIARVITRLIE